MSYCDKCGRKLPEGAKFCDACGNSIMSNEQSQRKILYNGEIRKCPNCGENFTSFQVKCSCGYELMGTKACYSVLELSKRLQDIENQRATVKYKYLQQSANGVDIIEQQKIELINNFPIPNTKEDLIEFIIMAKSNITNADRNFDGVLSSEEKRLMVVWRVKFEQSYQKAKLILDKSDFEKIEKVIGGTINTNKEIESQKGKKVGKTILAISIICLGLIFIMTGILSIIGLVLFVYGIVLLVSQHKKTSNKDEKEKRGGGYSSWSGFAKFWWIILNIYTIGIPAIIYACCRKNKGE